MKFRRRLEPRVGVDLVPMIDVLFQLILFLLVTTTFALLPGINLSLPESTTASNERTNGITHAATGHMLLLQAQIQSVAGSPAAGDTARRAAETAMRAAPDEDVPKVDLAAAIAADGKVRESVELTRTVKTQRDTDGPLNLDRRTIELLQVHGRAGPESRTN